MTSPRPDRAAYLVLGMHRSGTSAVSKVLAELGADLPAHPMAGDAHNEAGYYESWPIAVLNDQWLRAAGGAWEDPFAYPLAPMAPELAEEWLAKAVQVFDDEFGKAARPLLKDPRVSLLAPAWFEALERRGVARRCVIAVRGPAAVARSLQRRDGFTLERGALIWISYMLAAERYSRAEPRLFVAYDALLEDPRREAARLARAFGDADLDPAALGADSVSADLRHHATAGDADELGVGGPIAQALFDWLRRASADGSAPQAEIDALAADFAALRERLGGLVSPLARELDQTRAQLRFQTQLVDFQRNRLEDEIRRIGRDLAELRDDRDALARKLAASEPPPRQSREPLPIHDSEALERQLARFYDADYRDAWTAVDRDFYLSRYPDAAGFDPAAHYLEVGWREGRDPNAWFSTRAYLDARPDLLQQGINPLLHFLRSGLDQPPRPRPTAAPAPPAAALGPSFDEQRALVEPAFDRDYYLDVYADIREAGLDPLGHYLEAGWREGRDPSPEFSTLYYLEAHPEVAEAGVNPLLHYVTVGQGAGYHPRPHLGWRYDILEKLQDVEARIAWAAKKRGPVALRDARALADALRGAGPVHLTLSHDDFTERVGGVQLCIAREAAALAEEGRAHVHLFPSTASPVLSDDPDYAIAVLVDRRFVGDFAAADLARVLPQALAGRLLSVAIHNLLGHEPERVVSIIEACRPAATFFWSHDFAAVCAGYTLLRNDVAFCGAPPPDSPACGLCIYGPWRRRHMDGYRLVFDRLSPVLVSPSETTLRIWKQGGGPAGAAEVVHPHAVLTPKAERRPRGGPTVVAFCGLPVSHKGWPAFRDLAAKLRDDQRYEFYQLGDAPDPAAPVDFRRVAIAPDHLDAMRTAIRDLQVDLVVIWSICPETFSLTACEALAGGAAIAAFADSGNAAAIAEGSPAGVVLGSEAELLDFFASGRAAEFAASAPRALQDLTLSRMSADLIARPRRPAAAEGAAPAPVDPSGGAV